MTIASIDVCKAHRKSICKLLFFICQIHVITDGEEDMWTQAIAQAGLLCLNFLHTQIRVQAEL